MKKDYYNQSTGQYIYSVFFSSKKRKVNRYRKHYHTQTELGFVLKGSGEYNLSGEAYTVNGGDLFIVRSNEQHCIPTITTDTLVAVNMHISPYFLWNICTDYVPTAKIQALINPDIPICNKHTDREIGECFLRLAELQSSEEEETVFEVRRLVIELIQKICRKITVECTSDVEVTKRIEDIHRAIGYIKQNFQRDITLEDIAKSAAMSSSYFSGKFKAVTGMSPYNYLIITRIERAVELVRETDSTVMNIALECGFTSLTSFNKAFKQLVGMTPTELRQGGN